MNSHFDMGSGKYSTIRIEYPWTPQCCSNCKLFGHNLAYCHVMKEHNSKSDTTKSGNSVKEDGKEVSMADERKASQDKGVESRKDLLGDMGVDVTDNIVDGIVEFRGAESNKTGAAVHPNLPGNTFECLAQSEEECPSEVSKNLDASRSVHVNADFSDTSPTFDTFKHIKRIDELDYTPVPLSKKKLKKLKKQNQVSKYASVVEGTIHISNG